MSSTNEVKKSTMDKGLSNWTDLMPYLWVSICQAMKICLEAEEEEDDPVLAPDDKRFEKYKWNEYYGRNSKGIKKAFIVKDKCDTHFNKSFPTKKDIGKIYPRVLYLIIKEFNLIKISKKKNNENQPRHIPSPLYIIYSLLTDPEHPHTAAYSLTVCRNWLCRTLEVFPLREKRDKKNKEMEIYKNDFINLLESFSTYSNDSARWPDKRLIEGKNNKLHSFVGFNLSIRGFSYLWFQEISAAKEFLSFDDQDIDSEGSELNKKIASLMRGWEDKEDKEKKEQQKQIKPCFFRMNQKYTTLPSADEFINQLFGFPVPVKGMDVVFNGGLKPSASGGLVISLSGQPGTGKTSFCLALAEAFSPLGTSTFYIPLEETEDDITAKLENLAPVINSNLSIKCGIKNYFNCYNGIDFEKNLSIKELEKDILSIVTEIDRLASKSSLISGFCPAIVVIDNLNMIPDGSDTDRIRMLEKLVRSCRSKNVITIFVSARDSEEMVERLEYLTDIAIDMCYEKLGDSNDRPVRIFKLIKSRHQLARHGAHVFHLGLGKGFRIVPHMDSLMDKRQALRARLPDKKSCIPFLGTGEKATSFLKLYPYSNILLHGYGSSGKAGLALKILLTRPVPLDNKGMPEKSASDTKIELKDRRYILIISFLYPEDYFAELVDKICGKTRFKPVLDCMDLYPGYLGPQDFINKVVSRIDSAQLKGTPYTGILIDGLHNVALQFERLQSSGIVWAMLYNILSRYDLTVVSTFTNFSLTDEFFADKKYNFGIQDQLITQQGMTPFLHALVKAADFYLQLHEVITFENKRSYVLAVRTAIGQEVPSEYILWNRVEARIEQIIKKEELDNISKGKESENK